MLIQRVVASLCGVLAFAMATVTMAQKTPNPPGTGPFSVRTFAGGTKRVMLAVNPPTTYTDGSAIKQGTGVWIRIYRSMDGGKTFSTRVHMVSGGQGFVGQDKAGSRKKPCASSTWSYVPTA